MPGPTIPTLPRFVMVVRSVKLAVPVGAGNPNPNTEAVKSKLLPSGWSVNVVLVGSVPLTVYGWAADVLAANLLVGLNCAVSEYIPGANLSLSVAVPVDFTSCTVPKPCFPLEKATVPKETGFPPLVTVAVNVTTWPATTGD